MTGEIPTPALTINKLLSQKIFKKVNLKNCHNFADFRKLAKKKLPSPIFHYIDGAADDEVTYARNTSAFDDVDLVPNVLRELRTLIYQLQFLEKNLIYLFIFLQRHYKDFSL